MATTEELPLVSPSRSWAHALVSTPRDLLACHQTLRGRGLARGRGLCFGGGVWGIVGCYRLRMGAFRRRGINGWHPGALAPAGEGSVAGDGLASGW